MRKIYFGCLFLKHYIVKYSINSNLNVKRPNLNAKRSKLNVLSAEGEHLYN